jgi:hypothetical protein
MKGFQERKTEGDWVGASESDTLDIAKTKGYIRFPGSSLADQTRIGIGAFNEL